MPLSAPSPLRSAYSAPLGAWVVRPGYVRWAPFFRGAAIGIAAGTILAAAVCAPSFRLFLGFSAFHLIRNFGIAFSGFVAYALLAPENSGAAKWAAMLAWCSAGGLALGLMFAAAKIFAF